MSTNQTVESPKFEKIDKETGPFTVDAINLLWNAINDTRATERRDFRAASETIAPKLLIIIAAASVNDLDLQDASVLSFSGAAGENFTGMRAPSTGATRVVWVQNNGAGTITAKHNATSETANQLTNASGADVSLTTGKGIIYAYILGKWREVAH